MTEPLTIECNVHFKYRERGRKQLHVGTVESVPNPGRVPRVTRLLALAIRFDQLVRSGEISDYAELARLGHVSRARISQIMNLLMLAPDLQEEILFLPLVERGHAPIHIRQLQPIAIVVDWNRQRKMWLQLRSMGAIAKSMEQGTDDR